MTSSCFLKILKGIHASAIGILLISELIFVLKLYKKTASDALQEYIDHFEGRSPPVKHYTRTVSDLLSPKPKFKFLDAAEGKSNAEMSGNGLLSWINNSYNESLKSTCTPLFVSQSSDRGEWKRVSSAATSRTNVEGLQRQIASQFIDELSTLPSPAVSDTEIDSDQDTINTDILLKSYGAKSRGPAKSAWVKNSTSNTTYPKWVDEVNQSNDDQTDPRRLSSVSVLLQSKNHSSSLSHSKSMDATGLTMEDASSIDTDLILHAPVYGRNPINMGGDLHIPLFRDERVQKMLNESRKKYRKNVSKGVGRSVNSISSLSAVGKNQSTSSPQRKDVTYSEEILNRHRLLYNGNAADGKTMSKFEAPKRSSATQKNDGGRERNNTRRALATSSPIRTHVERYDSATEEARLHPSSLHSVASNQRQNLHSSLSPQANSYINKSVDRNRLPEKSSSTGVRGGSSREFYLHSYPSRSSDGVDVISPRTSGYHSDILSFDALQKNRKSAPSSKVSSQRSISPSRPSSSSKSFNRMESGRTHERKDSNATDILMRQPPIGTKVHQRSKTWGNMYSGVPAPPEASSTPIRQQGYIASIHSSAATSDPMLLSKTASDLTTRVPSTKSPRSASNERQFAVSSSSYPRFSERKNVAKMNRLSESAVASKPVVTYTNWKSSALNSRRQFGVTREEDAGETSTRPVLEYVESRYVAEDLHTGLDQADSNVESSERHSEEEEHVIEHNRTWPSIERMKERSTMTYLTSKVVQSSRGSWTSEKRSIPLRPQNRISTDRLSGTRDLVFPSRESIARTEFRNHLQENKQSRINFASPSQMFSRGRGFDEHAKITKLMPDDDDATIDTDLLLSQPPMPVVDASPSLSTLSDDDTIKGDDSGSDSQSFADIPLRSSSRVSFAPEVHFDRASRISPLSKFESTNPRTAETHLLRKSLQHSTGSSHQNGTFRGVLDSSSKTTKTELLDSFIEDCMQNSNVNLYKGSSAIPKRSPSKHASYENPRSVETLKNMLLNLSGMGSGEEKPAIEDEIDYAESGNTSDDAASVVGEQSLARAYHHLERLKSLINGNVDT